MPTYKIQAPDGKTITLEGPEGASQDDIIAQAQKLYKPSAAPKPAAAAPKPAAPKRDALQRTEAKRIWDETSAAFEADIADLPEAAKNVGRDNFFKDPRIRRLREAAARPAPANKPVAPQRRKDVIPDAVAAAMGPAGFIAKTLIDQPGKDFLDANSAATARSMFGVPELVASGITSLIKGTGYGEELDQNRALTDADRDKSVAGNILGTVYGSIASGNLAGAGVRGIGKAVAASGAPKAVKAAGRALESVATARKGSGVKNALSNVAKTIAAGAAGGAAQAAGEGSDVGTGATIGAVAAPVVAGVGRGAGWLLRPIGDLLGTSSAGNILRRFTKASAEDIRRAVDDYRQQTGAEPTLFEVLPQADRNRLAKDVVGSDPAVAERAAELVRSRFGNVGREMANTVEEATGQRAAGIVGQMEQDLATARGGAAPGDADLAAAASREPLGLKNLQRAESGAIMEPVENAEAAETVESIFPRTLSRNDETGEITEVYSDPEVNAALLNAASGLRLRRAPGDDTADIAGLTVGDMTRIVRQLGKIPANQPNFGAAQRAIDHVLRTVGDNNPAALARIEQMRAAYAARARQVEGMSEGRMQRTQAEAPAESQAQAQKLRNAYESPEGTAGRFLGQRNEVLRDLGGTPGSTIRAVDDLATSGNRAAALAGNLDPASAEAITGAARAQAQGVRNLASLDKNSSATSDTLSSEDLGRVFLALNPASMPTTKLFAISRLQALAGIPERKAREITNLLFSQVPAITNKGISLLNSQVRGGQQALQEIARGITTGNLSAQAFAGASQPGEAPELIPSAAAAEVEAPGIAGLVEEGNIDLNNRPVVQNDDGTISTVASITVGMDDGVYVLPTVVNGKVVSEDEAVAHFRQTGEHLGKFSDQASADAYAQQLHEDQAEQYGDEAPDDRPYGRAVIEGLFPDVHVTEDIRDPNSPLGRKNPGSKHISTDGAVDVRPIPGMTFDEFIAEIEANGYEVIEAFDEVNHPSGHATGPHWHVVLR